ncbi:MAG TPA: DUF1232 domain-containing protein [Cryptosporangiaceae bacterium]|nr:DUF1232 domain-containing protein [Cryptosporangiaceae bacterium]
MASNTTRRSGRRGRMAMAAEMARGANRPGSPGVGARLGAIPRMIKATLAGRYPYLSRGRLALLALGAGYIISPIDVIPEAFLLFLGVFDDLGVAALIIGSLFAETDRFLEWERTLSQTVDAEVIDG